MSVAPSLEVLSEVEPADALSIDHLTDLGNAERLVDRHGDELRFVPRLGWFVWDGRRWERDESGAIMRRAKQTVRELGRVALEAERSKVREAVLRHAVKSEGEARLRAAVALAESDERVLAGVDQLDADPWLLNVANGTVALEPGELVEHDRTALLTRLAPVEFSHGAEAPRWREFLEQVFAGDSELIAFVQRAVGYSLTGSTREQVLFLLHGSGDNGKSTFLETLRDLLGDYGQQAPAETFLTRRGETIPNDIARLRGARFVAAVETGEGRRLDEALVKRLTGGDTIAARFLRQEWFEFRPAFKPWLATNHLPEIRGTDRAIWRRIRCIPFAVTFSETERDLDLPAKLRAELPGILRWAVDGCHDWVRRGLGEPSAVEAATADYRSEMDVLGRFLDECCVVAADAEATAQELFNRYVYWSGAAGERGRLTQTAFGRQLRDRPEGFKQTRSSGGKRRLWLGLRLRDDAGGEV